MKVLRSALFVLLTLALAAPCSPQSPAKAPPAAPITGTISSSQSIIEAVLGSNKPARWHGITFRLKEHPEREFVFNSSGFEHAGRNLTGKLTGTQVEVTCKTPATQKTCRVTTLKWLSPLPPLAKKKK
jgi:hypothetical protein